MKMKGRRAGAALAGRKGTAGARRKAGGRARTSAGPQGLEQLPNIGATVAERLRAAGIGTPAALARIGSVGGALRLLRSGGEPPCRSMLCGLEGALRGVRWHAIPKEERDALWEEYRRRAG